MHLGSALKIFALVLLFLPGAAGWPAGSEFSMEKAREVDRFIKQIGKLDREGVFLKDRTFTQRELNSYLNLIYIKRYAPEIKYIKLKLEKKNRVEGTLRALLTGDQYEKLPSFLRELDIDFSGHVECENYRMRYAFDTIRINGTRFAPEILDEAFAAAQSGFRLKKSIFDWFNLMPGLKNLVIDYKKITLYY